MIAHEANIAATVDEWVSVAGALVIVADQEHQQ
jgi:hypothetical protein